MKTMNTFHSAIAPTLGWAIGGILFASAFLSTNGYAVPPTHASIIVQQHTSLATTTPLQQFVGYYQLPNKVAFIQFEVKGNALFATQLWDNKVYELAQLDETHFESKKEGHKVEFLKDSSGQFTSAKILGRITTAKVGFDPTTVKQLSAAQLKQLEGTYTFKDDNTLKLNIRSSASGLTVKQLWDNKEIAFTPRSETFFVNADGTFPLTFSVSSGAATQVTCFEDDVWFKAQ